MKSHFTKRIKIAICEKKRFKNMFFNIQNAVVTKTLQQYSLSLKK